MRRGSSSLLLFTFPDAEIAQLVEHNLAKVGVAGPSPVFRSYSCCFYSTTFLAMNLYLRYFNDETLVHDVEEALVFLSNLDEIEITPELEADLREYVESSDFYPKRYKVHSRQYFIVIKTEAETLQDFKDKKAVRQPAAGGNDSKAQEQKRLQTILPGWYEGTLDFKRVVVNHLGKCEYRDTTFTAQCKAESIQDCYNRICDYLLTCVDKRSQFPAARGKNFHCHYLGAEKPQS